MKNGINTLAQEVRTLPIRVKYPWTSNYRPDTDTSPELFLPRAAYYQSRIGILRWITELRRLGITMETSAMASMMAMPREGRLDQILHMFVYLRIKNNSLMVFDKT